MAEGRTTTRRRTAQRSTASRARREPKRLRRQSASTPLWVSLAQRAIAFLAAAALIYVLVLFLTSSLFTVNRLEVYGNHFVDAEMVAEITGAYGQNVFMVSSHDAEARVATLPQVESVEVQPSLPDLVVVRIQEREVAYTWRSGEKAFGVAHDGTVLGEIDADYGVATILDKGNRQPQLGDRLGQEVLRSAGRLTAWLPDKTGLEAQHFEYSQAEGLTLISGNGYQVMFGSTENLGAKVAALQSILEQLAKEGRTVQYIDLRVEGRPIVR